MNTVAWIIIYLLQYILISTLIGMFLVNKPQYLPIHVYCRFLSGFALTPYFLGLYVLFLSYCGLYEHKFIYIWGPILISSVIFILARKKLIKDNLPNLTIACSNKTKLQSFTKLTALICLVFIILTLIHKFPDAIKYPNANNDYLQYMAEAQTFIDKRDILHIPEYFSQPESLKLSFMHGFIYQAYLGQALLFTPSEQIGHPNDQVAKIAFLLTILTMCISVGILAFSLRGGGLYCVVLSLTLLLIIPSYNYIYNAFSREAFRITPLLILASLLLSLTPDSVSKQKYRTIALSIFFLSALTCMGHTFGLFSTVLTVAGWFTAWHILYGFKYQKKSIIFIIISSISGFLWGSQSYIKAFIITGSAPTPSSVEPNIFEGTIIIKNLSENVLTYTAKISWLETMKIIINHSNKIIFTGCLFFILIYLLLIITNFPTDHSKVNKPGFVTLCFISLFNASLWIGFFDFLPVSGELGITLSQWFARNLRYILAWLPFLVILGSLSLISIIKIIAEKIDKINLPNKIIFKIQSVYFENILIIFIIILLSFNTIKQIKRGWRNYNPVRASYVMNILKNFNEALTISRPDSIIIGDDDRFSYYLKNQIGYLGTPPTRNLIQAKNFNDVNNELLKLNVGIVYFANKKNSIYKNSVIWNYLHESEYSTLIESHNHNGLIFVLK